MAMKKIAKVKLLRLEFVNNLHVSLGDLGLNFRLVLSPVVKGFEPVPGIVYRQTQETALGFLRKLDPVTRANVQ